MEYKCNTASRADTLYQYLIMDILKGGDKIKGRNGFTRSIFGHQSFVFLEAPLVGFRKIKHILSIQEMEWFINHIASTKSLPEAIVPWWEPFADSQGFTGIYHYHTYLDSMYALIEDIKNDPHSRRHVLSAWNYEDQKRQAKSGRLTNCHSTMCQFKVDSEGELHYITYQRSADVIIGLPFNWIQHWAILEFVAAKIGFQVGTMQYILGDAHIYEDHVTAAEDIITCQTLVNNLSMSYSNTDKDFKASDFTITGECNYPVKTKVRMVV